MTNHKLHVEWDFDPSDSHDRGRRDFLDGRKLKDNPFKERKANAKWNSGWWIEYFRSRGEQPKPQEQ
jgi:hypothetical protein